MKSTSLTVYLVISLSLVAFLALPARADQEDSSKAVKMEVAKDATKGKKVATKKASPGSNDPSYDSFTDKNKNGVDDRFEKASKEKVKVKAVQDPAKPTETKSDDKKEDKKDDKK